MKKFKFILKGILFYTTVIAVLLFICSVDSLCNNGEYFFPAAFIVAILGFTCEQSISEEELNTLTGNMLP